MSFVDEYRFIRKKKIVSQFSQIPTNRIRLKFILLLYSKVAVRELLNLSLRRALKWNAGGVNYLLNSIYGHN